MTNREAWNREYDRRGIPSSFRDEPSGSLVWALESWFRLTGEARPESALDSGCGTGRNTAFLRAKGIAAVGVDFADAALTQAGRRAVVVQADLTAGIPFHGASFDLVCDLFVYKHLVDAALRAAYRREIARVLRPYGRLFVSLAEARDGFYSTCEHVGDSVVDPVTGVGSVLFTLADLIDELSDCFALEMSWEKQKPGMMHGREYPRRTIASIWRLAG